MNPKPTGATSTSHAEPTSRDTRRIGGLFRDISEAETGHAFGHLDFLKEAGDPATGEPHRQHRGQPQVRHRRRDLRLHRDVPRLRAYRA